MFYLIQNNLFSDRNYNKIVNILKRMELPYEDIAVLPFLDELPIKTDRKDVFVFGSVKLAHLSKRLDLTPGSFYNENHDYEVYSKHYGQYMLNSDAHIMSIKDDVPKDYHKVFFARPCGDNKAFNGQVFMEHSWKQLQEFILANDVLSGISKNVEEEKMLLTSLKETTFEVRCWVIKGEVVTMSRYKLGGKIIAENFDRETWIKERVQDMIKLYQPADAFVIDVCAELDKPQDDLKIVEINCINASGFYDGDVQKIIETFENYYVS